MKAWIAGEKNEGTGQSMMEACLSGVAGLCGLAAAQLKQASVLLRLVWEALFFNKQVVLVTTTTSILRKNFPLALCKCCPAVLGGGGVE